MKTNTLKIITLLVSILAIGLLQAQWTGTNPITTNSNVNVGGLQYGNVHFLSKKGQMVAFDKAQVNADFNVLSLSKEISRFDFRTGRQIILKIPTWGFAIDDKSSKLSINYTDLVNQPRTQTTPLFGTQSITQTTWPIPTEIFSINSNEVISNVELKLITFQENLEI
ncbi:MAG: hypothetical protein MUF43_14965 [Flavobacterium sp.]|nr:hypothetical protein [Flavobacterium sp.]